MTTSHSRHAHYFKNVAHLQEIDVYRVIELFGVTSPCLQHAVKKLLVSDGRGAGKTQEQDVREAIDSCLRYLAMCEEDAPLQATDTTGKHDDAVEIHGYAPVVFNLKADELMAEAAKVRAQGEVKVRSVFDQYEVTAGIAPLDISGIKAAMISPVGENTL